MSNLKEFKELILEYEGITLSDIEYSESYQNDMSKNDEVWFSEKVMQELTGYGNIGSCTLCTAIKLNPKLFIPSKIDCKDCTWVKQTNNQCFSKGNARTYTAFHELQVESEDGLVEACHARADYMRNIIGWFDKEIIKINNMTEKKSDVNKITKGDHYSRLSYGIVTRAITNGFEIANEEGNRWSISEEIIENEFYFHNQVATEVKITRTELAEIFINHPRMIMTANYHKQVKEKDINEGYFKLYANKGGIIISESEYQEKVKKLTKVALKGEERTIVGRHEGSLDDFGRMHFTDVEADWDKTKDYDTRHRLVDPRTLNWVIVGNVQYSIK